MVKRGQVTVFVIIGILILLVIGILLYFQFGLKEVFEESKVAVEAQPVKEIIDDCVEKVSLSGLELIGQQGGYIDIGVKDSLKLDTVNSVYWVDESGIVVPELKNMEKELEDYVEDNLEECADFSNLDIKVNSGNVDVDVAMSNKVSVKVTWPITVTKDASSYSFDKFLQDF